MKLKNSFDKILKSKGFKKIELSHIIPSMKALKRSGDIRRNMFSYYDDNFQEISLRPDLSLSAALKFAEEKTNLKKKYFYSGLAYRKPTKNNDLPIISQFGWEIFNSKDKHKDDKEIIETSLKILKNTKFKGCKLKIGNLEIFVSLINRLPNLSSRYKDRLVRHFFRKDYFNKLLKKLETNYDIDERGAYFVCIPIYIRPEWGRATGQNLQNFTYITVNEIDNPGDHYVFLRVSKAEA